MKPRHHNNKGLRQIRRGKTRRQVECMAARLGIPFSHRRVRPGDIRERTDTSC